MTELTRHDGAPFDAIRQVRDDGSEFWSARDLCLALEYDQWRNFTNAVEKARMSIRNQGLSGLDHVADASKMVDLGLGTTREIEDFHLTRFAAYLVVMNGDPRKERIAEAQAYFAIKTREAEVAPAELDEIEVAERYLIALREKKALAAQVAELEPRAAVADHLLNASGDMSVGDAAKTLARSGASIGATRLFALLDSLRWTYKQGKDRHVAQRAIEAGYLAALPRWHYHPQSGEVVVDAPQVRVTPKGIARLLTHLLPSEDAA